jgi:hypothetical protein
MKIISKFKDYYDYYSGIFGEDPLKVLDRKEYHYEPEYSKKLSLEKIELLFFCGKWYIRGLTNNLKEQKFSKYIFDSNFRQLNLNILYQNEIFYWSEIVNYDEVKNQLFTDDTLNIISKSIKPYFVIKYDYYCRRTNKSIYKDFYPILKEIEFDKVLDAKECYLEIEQYISKKDINIETNPDDKILLEQKGFDKKISFRHRK